MEKEKIIDRVVEIIRRHLDKSHTVFLFGSWAKGTALATSDLDIAILGPEEINQETMIAIKQDVEDIPTLRGIDIVDLKTTSEEFKNNVLQHAQRIDL